MAVIGTDACLSTITSTRAVNSTLTERPTRTTRVLAAAPRCMAASSAATANASSRGLRPLQFPFREFRGPGPSPHVVLCAATGREGDASFAIVFYTTSQIDFHGARRPRQYLLVDKARPIELGQKTAFQGSCKAFVAAAFLVRTLTSSAGSIRSGSIDRLVAM